MLEDKKAIRASCASNRQHSQESNWKRLPAGGAGTGWVCEAGSIGHFSGNVYQIGTKAISSEFRVPSRRSRTGSLVSPVRYATQSSSTPTFQTATMSRVAVMS